MPPDAPIPDEIAVSRGRHEMTFRWADGRVRTASARTLRSACRCAWCTRDRVLERFELADASVAIVDVEALGSHGLHIRFSDGHERGIFPWAYLDALMQADETAPLPPRLSRGTDIATGHQA